MLAQAERLGVLEVRPDAIAFRHELAWALGYHGLLLTAVDRYAEALHVGDEAVALAERLGAPDLLALAHVLRGRARLQLGDEVGLAEMREGSLGAAPAGRVARRRLREAGVRQVPRGPQAATRANPAGLTERQVEILRLLAEGLTNAEIAARLVVSAVLQKLGLSGRREAAAALAVMGLAEVGIGRGGRR